MPDTRLIEHYFPQWMALSARLMQLHDLLLSWNSRINLVSRKDTEHLWAHHLLHGLCITHYWQPAPGAQVLDIGCGGGLPGLPLALCYPGVQFTLLDSTRKKIDAVEAIAQEMGLANVRPTWQRAEEHSLRYDYILGRAVTALPGFIRLARPRLRAGQAGNLPSGILYLKGGDFAEELAQITCRHSLHPLKEVLPLPFYDTKFLVYLSDCR
ncbi:MAG: 16S rRNA (guanine(527)-N(7))-methyltransferase RsmG [Bacteroidetes bacterium]|nr:16S rRNA (guanine(527)-N(7))-methyltransferase RsmG [Bacteroidota bacterium]